MNTRAKWRLLQRLHVAKIVQETGLDIRWKFNLKNPITWMMFSLLIPTAIVVGTTEALIKVFIDMVNAALSEVTETHTVFKSDITKR